MRQHDIGVDEPCRRQSLQVLGLRERPGDAADVQHVDPAAGPEVELKRAERLARLFKALGDPTRVRLVSLIAAHQDGEACVCDLTAPVGLSQGTASHHLKQLVDAGLITRERRDRWSYYRVVDSALTALADALARR